MLGTLAEDFYICEAGDDTILGKYTKDGEKDGVATYSNSDDMSLFRNQGFWYIGNLGPWPPETHYRCVKDCGRDLEFPPLKTYTKSKQHGTDPEPRVQDFPCGEAAPPPAEQNSGTSSEEEQQQENTEL